MNLSRRNKYLSVIAVCGVALLVDRFALPRPAPAESALVLNSARGVNVDRANARPTFDLLPVPEIPFPKNLHTVTPQVVLRDFFARRGDIEAPSKATTLRPRPGESGTTYIAVEADEFEAKHKLTGIMLDERFKVAVLGADWVELGRDVDGCFLKDLKVDAAIFACPDRDAILYLHKAP